MRTRPGLAHRVTCAATMGAILALSLVACSSPSAEAKGEDLSLGVHYAIDSMNPFIAESITSLAVFEYMYPALVQYSTSLKFSPDFATSWKESPGGTTWTLHTRPRAEWSDGTPLTAADAAWTIDTVLRYQTGGTAALAGYLADVKYAATAGPDTLVVHMGSPEAAFLANIRQLPILPAHIWKRYAAGKDGADLKTFSNQPSANHPVVSGGPFICTGYQPQGVSLFKRNPMFFGEQPKIAELAVEYFTSPDAELQALRNGQLDAAVSVPPSGVTSLRADPGIVIHSQPGANEDDLTFNDYTKQRSDTELTLPIVHLAFDYAINRRQIIKYAYDGYAAPASSPIPVALSEWHDAAIKPPSFDLPEAGRLLDQAGFKMSRSGIRIADGHPMSYTVDMAADENGPGNIVFQIIQADLQKVGVHLTLDSIDDSTAASLEVSPSTRFHIMMWGWTSPPDPNFLLNSYTCGQLGGWNETGYCDATYDKLYDEQATTIGTVRRAEIVDQMQGILAKEAPELMIVYGDQLDAWNKAWTGFGETDEGLFTPLTTMGLLAVRHA